MPSQRASVLCVVFLALSSFLAQCLLSSREKSPVNDAHLHYGYGELILGRALRNGELPAWDGTMPVSALNVLSDRARSVVPALPSVMPDRLWVLLPNLLLGSALILMIGWWSWRFLGPGYAAIAVALASLEPNLIGHSRFLTTDVPSAFGFFAGLAALTWFLSRPSRLSLGLCALILALAQLTKISNLLLYPIAVIAFVAWKASEGQDLKQMLRGAFVLTACCAAVFLLTLHLAYSGTSESMNQALRAPAFWNSIGKGAPAVGGLESVMPLPYVGTLAAGRFHNATGHPAYLCGEHRTHGWVYYFPVAIAAKTPLPLLILAVAGLLFGYKGNRALLVVIFGAVAYLAVFCLLVKVNIGVRHVLPVYPALILLGAVGVVRLWQMRASSGRVLVAVLLLWSAREATQIHPHFEQYFNQLAGGPGNGWKMLGDSNTQWGQDEQLIRKWIASQDQPVALNPTVPIKGLVVVRADFLVGHTLEMAASFAWLRDNYSPRGYLTPGVLIYDVR